MKYIYIYIYIYICMYVYIGKDEEKYIITYLEKIVNTRVFKILQRHVIASIYVLV